MASLFDATTRHSVYLSRYSTHVAHRLIALLNRAEPDLVAQILLALDRLPADSFTVERLELVLAAFRSMNAGLHRQIGEALTGELRTFSAYEAGFQQRMLVNAAGGGFTASASFTAATGEQVYAAALSRPFQGVLLREALDGVEAATAKRVRDAIRMGYVEGEPIDRIVRRIRGTRAAGYSDGLLDWTRRDVAAVTRTAVAHTANVARQETYAANDIERWMFVATLDNRTTVTCASLSGKTFPAGKGPMPPRHYNCRSTSIPLLPGQTSLTGTRPSIDYRDDRPKARQVDANMSFSTWLRGQGAEVQDEVLGAERAKLFRSKKIEVDRFTDRTGRVYTLEELKRRDAALFD